MCLLYSGFMGVSLSFFLTLIELDANSPAQSAVKDLDSPPFLTIISENSFTPDPDTDKFPVSWFKPNNKSKVSAGLSPSDLFDLESKCKR